MIDADLVRRLIGAQFPHWAELPVRPVDLDGWDNRTFRLGDELSVRLPSGDWYALQVAKEQRWLPILASRLPLPVPTPVAQGEPAFGYPYPWSVYRWLPGEPAQVAAIGDQVAFVTALAEFLLALREIPAEGGPAPGRHNFFRGAPVSTYHEETVRAVETLGPTIPREDVLYAWNAATKSTWQGPPVWFHGDVAAGNLLVRDGRLAAVIDFGSSGVGDPACDLVIAWTFFAGAARSAFRDRLGADAATWARARGWALWKALISLAGARPGSSTVGLNQRVLREILADAS